MTKTVLLKADDGSPLNAKLDVEPRGLVLHSRSGTDRNRDYRQALELIMARLNAATSHWDLFLDSRPVQHVPLDQRRLVFSRQGPVETQFNAAVKAMNHGSASHGAWRRVLITAPGKSPLELASVVSGKEQSESGEAQRLPASTLKQVKAHHVDAAVAKLLSGHNATNFAPSRDYDLITPSGQRLAPKKVFGLALEAAVSINAMPGHFSAGRGTLCFSILEASGYPIIAKDEHVPGNLVDPVDDDLAAAEGQPKLVTHMKRERNPALAAAKRRAVIEQHGYLACERCKLVPSAKLGPHGDAVIEIHHAVTQVSDMQPGHVTRLADLMCLCANCHRIVHRELSQ